MSDHLRVRNELVATSEQLDKVLHELLPQLNGSREDRLFDAMRYATLSNGKRIRPFLTIHIANIFGVNQQCSLRVAAAMELIHSYSLVHDDLPAIDNDDLRRGLPSCHKKFDEATAILAGDALLTYAFEILSDPLTHIDPLIRIDLVRSTAEASGHKGMIGGQMLDLLSEHQDISPEDRIHLQKLKTGELIATSCEAGAILGKASSSQRSAIRAYGYNIGMIFQIIDDILDLEGTSDTVGKTVGKDNALGKATLVSSWGLDECRNHIEKLAQHAISHLESIGYYEGILKDIVFFLIDRDH